MTPENEKRVPGVGQYVLAWNIASLSTLVLLIALNRANPSVLDLVFGLSFSDEDVLWRLVLEIPLQIAVWLIVWIPVYSWFRTLRISAVMPWLWAVALFGGALNTFNALEVAPDTSQLAALVPLYALSLFSEVKIFQLYFRSKGRMDD